MRIAYLDCFAGVAGDMFLGALLQAGVPAEVLHEATAALDLGASLKIETVDRSGISSIKVHVFEDGTLAEGQAHNHQGEHSHEPAAAEHQRAHDGHSQQLQTQHLHKTGHAHTHEQAHSHEPDAHSHEPDAHSHEPNAHSHEPDAHSHEPDEHPQAHGRSLTDIRALISAANLHDAVKSLSIKAFELLGHSEAKIHNVPVDQIHFHEVGAVDAIVDIVASCAGIHHLQIGKWYASAVNVGGGMVECAHGTFPVPAPATADLLRGVPTYSAHVKKELVTPTGAALLRALDPTFGEQPAMRTEAIGYGAGTRNPEGFPNVLRLSVGEGLSAATMPADGNRFSETDPTNTEIVTVLETALDDASPQVLAYVAEKALATGALDVMLTPVIMKKGRPGTLITLLCNPDQSGTFEQLLLSETSTLGLRIRQDRRICLERSHSAVETPFGTIRVKVGQQGGEERNVAPEYEDCRAAATQHGVALKLVQQGALAAYRRNAQGATAQ